MPSASQGSLTVHDVVLDGGSTLTREGFIDKGRGSAFDFERTDGVVRRAALRNVDLLPIVFYAPRWARAYRNRFTSPPKRRADYVTYLAALVDRYGPDGTFWAEHPELPNHPVREWQGPSTRYASRWISPELRRISRLRIS